MPDDKDKPKKKPPGKPRDREDPPGLFPEHSAYDLEPIVIPAHEKLHADLEPEEKAPEREYKPLPEHSVFDLEPIVIPADMKLGPTASQLPDESHYDLPPVDHNSKLMPMDTSEPPKVEQAPKEPLKNIDRASVFAPEPEPPQSVFAPDPPTFAPEPPAFTPQMPSLGQPQAFEPSSPFAPSQPSFPGALPPPPPGRPTPAPAPAPASALPYLWSQGQISNATTVVEQALAGSYTILDTIGQGGMAIVYKARQENTDRLVAIKTLKDTSPDVMKRFLREVEAHARLKHKNIVEAIDCVEAGNLAFLVMEYIEGISLQDRIRKEGRIESAEELASILIQICNALDHAHQKKIIHRDLKSGNFLLLKDDNGDTIVKILDFGIAKIQDDTQRLTIEGKSLGSPLYMSPEQCTGSTLTASSDVYSLGMVAYEMATGRLPYQRTSIVEIMTAHCDPKIRPEPLQNYRPDLPGIAQLDQVLEKALETKIEHRFRNMTQFRQGIEFWIDAVRQGKTQSALPDDIMVNKIDPEEVRTNEIKKSMHQLMEVRREQLGKTTTTTERGKFASETAPPKKRKGKLIGQLVLLFSLFVILTLGMAALAITNLDYVTDFLANISKSVESMLGGRSAAPAPAENAPSVVPPNSDGEATDGQPTDAQKQNSDETEGQAPTDDSRSTNTDRSGKTKRGGETQTSEPVETSDAPAPQSSAPATDSSSSEPARDSTESPPPKNTSSDSDTTSNTSKTTNEVTSSEETAQPKSQDKEQVDETTNKPRSKEPATTGGTFENFDPE